MRELWTRDAHELQAPPPQWRLGASATWSRSPLHLLCAASSPRQERVSRAPGTLSVLLESESGVRGGNEGFLSVLKSGN